jgi:putative salt-induced outer membrane protein
MPRIHLLVVLLIVCAIAAPVAAQDPKAPPPLWDASIGASFVGTSGNSDTSTLGAEAAAHRRWPLWQIEATGVAIHTTDDGVSTAERYLGTFRANRKLSTLLSLTAGERVEGDRFSGISFRSITDGGLNWALLRETRWTLDGITSIGVNHEVPVTGETTNDAIGVLGAVSKIVLGTTADSIQRFTYYPDFTDSAAYRMEAEITAQAAINDRLALKFGYLWRRSNDPQPGFLKDDSTTTASIVVRWKASTPAP